MEKEIYTYTEIGNNIWQIEEDNGVYCTLVKGSELAVLIDTGYGRRDLRAFVEKNVSTPYLVINSHGHPDHIGGNSRFDTVYAMEEEWDVVRHFEPDTIASYQRREIKPGRQISLGGRNMQVVSLAGHTKGSAGFLILEEKILIAGDAFNEELWLFNYGSLSMKQLYETIQAAAGLEFTSYLCGHSSEIFKKEKLSAHLRNIENLKVDETMRQNTIGFDTYRSVYEDADGRSAIVFTIDKVPQ